MLKNATGILKPTLQNRWRLLFNDDNENDKLFSMQAVNCSINYVDKLLFLEFQQNESCDTFHKMFIQLSEINKPCLFYVQTLDGNGDVTSSIKVNTKAMLNHKFELNYASSDFARHRVCFKVNKFRVEMPSSDSFISEFELS